MKISTPWNRYFHAIVLAGGQYRLSAGVARRGVSWAPFLGFITPGTCTVAPDPPREIVFHWRLGPVAIGMARDLP